MLIVIGLVLMLIILFTAIVFTGSKENPIVPVYNNPTVQPKAVTSKAPVVKKHIKTRRGTRGKHKASSINL